MSVEAILWDCDGCLIDSEAIACGHAAEELTQAGYPLSMEEFVLRFAGKTRSDIYSVIQQETGLTLADKIDRSATRTRRNQLFREHLRPISGIIETLDTLSLPMAVASGSEFERLEFTLRIVGLFERLMPHIYSADIVAHGKPAPDIFLHAATQLGVPPARCLVVEDSENGVRAGVAAGMKVLGFIGGAHIIDKQAHTARLLALGAAQVIDDIRVLPALCYAAEIIEEQNVS